MGMMNTSWEPAPEDEVEVVWEDFPVIAVLATVSICVICMVTYCIYAVRSATTERAVRMGDDSSDEI